MKTRIILLAVAMLVGLAAKNPDLNSPQATQAKIQIALLLDTSNSMDGLINQAKTQLWNIVNEMATAKYEGERPTLEIALYEYGNDGLSSSEGYIRMVSGFTTDLDLISEKLFGLTTNGGEEYCGYVINKAMSQLEWSKSNTDLKIIYIAGNEPFNQGGQKYEEACKTAITQGVVVNTIFCGDFQEGVNTYWKNGADLADGSYININPNEVVVDIPSPYDDEIVKLNADLNKTYIAYGTKGKEYKKRQEMQDDNATGAGASVIVQRSVSKSSANYSNAHWDIVDAYESDAEVISDLSDEELPEEMKGMNKEEQKVYLDKKQKEREEIQIKIQELNEKRTLYVNEKRKEMAEQNTLDNAIITSARNQAIKLNYSFDK